MVTFAYLDNLLVVHFIKCAAKFVINLKILIVAYLYKYSEQYGYYIQEPWLFFVPIVPVQVAP